jgi:hypothetical protein
MTITTTNYSYGRLTLMAYKAYRALTATESYDEEEAAELYTAYQDLYAKAKATGEMS